MLFCLLQDPECLKTGTATEEVCSTYLLNECRNAEFIAPNWRCGEFHFFWKFLELVASSIRKPRALPLAFDPKKAVPSNVLVLAFYLSGDAYLML